MSFVSICGFDSATRPVQIISKSVKAVKAKTAPFLENSDQEFLSPICSQKYLYPRKNLTH